MRKKLAPGTNVVSENLANGKSRKKDIIGSAEMTSKAKQKRGANARLSAMRSAAGQMNNGSGKIC